MDTSETYIKMRLAAIPDLGMGKLPNSPLLKDGVAWVNTTVFVDRHGNYYHSKVNILPIGYFSEACQLERQDELQEMVGDCNNPYPLIQGFASYSLDCRRLDGKEWIMTSMEQLWLAFVMKEKNKVWTGEEWREDERSKTEE